MRTILTAILLLASLTANAGRFYYYHYEGPRNNGGLYLLLILIGILLLIALVGAVIESVDDSIKISKRQKYKPGCITITTTNGKFSAYSAIYHIHTVKSTHTTSWAKNVWLDDVLITNGAFWAPLFTEPKIEHQSHEAEIWSFKRSYHTFNGRHWHIPGRGHAYHVKDRLIIAPTEITIEEAERLVEDKCGRPITVTEIITTAFAILAGVLILSLI